MNKFKVGDKVRLTKHYSEYWPENHIFVITSITGEDGKYLHGKTTTGSIGSIMADWCVHEESELERLVRTRFSPHSKKQAFNMSKFGYMCMIDWQHELGEAAGGVRIYASLADLKEHHSCYEECGVVEVSVKVIKTVVPQNIFGDDNE